MVQGTRVLRSVGGEGLVHCGFARGISQTPAAPVLIVRRKVRHVVHINCVRLPRTQYRFLVANRGLLSDPGHIGVVHVPQEARNSEVLVLGYHGVGTLLDPGTQPAC